MNVLVAPLDWGLGHATRCVPLINELQRMGHTVMIAGCGPSLQLLKIEFPTNRFFEIASYNVEYSKSLILGLLLKAPALLSTIRKEHDQVAEIVRAENVDVIISDNRYGCYHETIPCAIITHQLSIRASVLSSVVNHYNRKFISRFSECWVPDTPDHRLSGQLSVNPRIKSRFIGPLSRMRPGPKTGHVDILGLISGPEPHRSAFEEQLFVELEHAKHKSGLSYVIVRGLPGSNFNTKDINHLPASELSDLIRSADLVICRSGYSSIMDLAALNKKAIFVPTPGQTEQLYLARELDAKRIAPCVLPHELFLPAVLEKMKNYTGFTGNYFDNNLLQTTLREFLG